MDKNIADLRKDYTLQDLSEKEIDPNPFIQFKFWFDQALAAQLPGYIYPRWQTFSENGIIKGF
jgi:pyridoxine/pyridoxamine 5'-phosphate oxidase